MAHGVVVIGASVAGVGVAEELRALGYALPIYLVDAQPQLPYDRPPLSKGVLTGKTGLDDIAFHPAEYYETAGIDLRLGTRVVGLDPRRRVVLLEDDATLLADAIVIATGAQARRWPGGDGTVCVVREQSDALRLRDAFADARRVAVVGGGFIGAEVASSAAALGLEVTVIEAAGRPLEARLGSEVAELLLGLHQSAGVQVWSGTAVDRIDRRQVTTDDGRMLDADVVVAGLGAVPAVEWLSGSNLSISSGVVCDDRGRTAFPGVHAIGDVAAWADPVTGRRRRHEHWTSAREQARIVAHDIIGQPGPAWSDSVDYVWSDQHGHRIQLLGRPDRADTVHVVDHDPATGRFLALYGLADRLVGVVGCRAGATVLQQRRAITEGAPFDAVVSAFASVGG
jgi:NADPH-dependent 2,4-dienoyl-CoA reductase/sulfur reductase-like enzyme